MADGSMTGLMSSVMFAALPSLAGVYVIALLVGGGLVVVSALTSGGGEHDIGGGDFHGDAAGGDAFELHEGGIHLADWFSVRFVIYFAAMFGLTGTALTGLTQMGRANVLVIAIFSGLIVGQIVHQMMAWLRRSDSDSSTRLSDYIDRPGRVTAAIRAGGRGEVAIQIRDGERYLPAMARREDESFTAGSEVAVVEVQGGTAVVISRKEFEFLRK